MRGPSRWSPLQCWLFLKSQEAAKLGLGQFRQMLGRKEGLELGQYARLGCEGRLEVRVDFASLDAYIKITEEVGGLFNSHGLYS